jgi:rhamnose transport system substrate-binding protein
MNRKLKNTLFGAAALAITASLVGAQSKPFTLYMIPKFVGILYFDASQKGAEEAAGELGINLIHRGPNEGSVPKQIELVETAIQSKVDVVSIAANDNKALAPSLRKAKAAGIKVITWDADADVRDLFVNQATYQSIGETMLESMVSQVGPEAEVAIVTTTLTAPNQNAWIGVMKEIMAKKYPKLKVVDTRAPGENQQKSLEEATDLLKVHPNLKGIWAMGGVPFPGVAEAVKQAGLSGKVAVVGLATPLTMAPYIKDGTVRDTVLWSPVDLGYLSVYAAKAAMEGPFKIGQKIKAGRLGEFTVKADRYGKTIVLGPAKIYNKANIDTAKF